MWNRLKNFGSSLFGGSGQTSTDEQQQSAHSQSAQSSSNQQDYDEYEFGHMSLQLIS
jgi:hypothetical protein